MEIKSIIKNRRLECGLTLKEVANKVGVSEGTVSRWESGKIEEMRRDKIMLLANALQISPAVIMGWDDKEDSPLRSDEQDLLYSYNLLNDVGRAEALQRVREMSEVERFTKDTILLNA